jgi:hypothetical protein
MFLGKAISPVNTPQCQFTSFLDKHMIPDAHMILDKLPEPSRIKLILAQSYLSISTVVIPIPYLSRSIRSGP